MSSFLSMFDADAIVESSHSGGKSGLIAPNSVRLSINRDNSTGKARIRIRFSADISSRMKWIRGDRVKIGFNRERRIMGISRIGRNDLGFTLGTGSKSGDRTLSFTVAPVRFAEDLRPIIMGWVGDGRIVEARLTGDVVYWEVVM